MTPRITAEPPGTVPVAFGRASGGDIFNNETGRVDLVGIASAQGLQSVWQPKVGRLMRFIPKWCAPYVIAALVSGGMSLAVSGFATWRALGLVDGFAGIWMTTWVWAWLIAFPALVFLRPIVTRFVMARVRGG